MKLRLLLVSTFALAVSAPAMADKKPAGADKDNTQAPQKERKICRNETMTGSLIAKRRICLTKGEWDKLALETRKDLEDIQRNSGAIPHSINPAVPNQGGMTAGFQ